MRRILTVLATVLVMLSPVVYPRPASAMAGNGKHSGRPAAHAKPAAKESAQSEGPLSTAEIIVGPFDLHRRYRSMEGPYVVQKFRISDLIKSGHIELPESMVTFVEGNPSGAPSMAAPQTSSTNKNSAIGLVDTSGQRRELYWFKGMKIDVLDENGKPLPTAEFICHLNLDLDPAFRNKVFPEGERCHNTRIVTLTQGQTDVMFPQGFGVPVASDEQWTLTFQAANRTTDAHRRIKHRCFMYFVKDSDLLYPIKPLAWFAPYIAVIVDKDTAEAAESEHKGMPDCLGTSAGVTAPNSVPGALITDSLRRRLSGHWVIPPGTHSYNTPIVDERDPGFASQDRIVHFVWSHVHPLCSSASLQQCGGENVFTAHCRTDTSRGLQIQNIETISSKEGIRVPAGKQYQVAATYENTTDKPQDSMVVLGIFFEDNSFARPDWFLTEKNEAFCGVNSSAPHLEFKGLADSGVQLVKPQEESTSSATAYTPPYPLFDIAADGPLLKQSRFMELNTTAGKIHIELDPAMAPVHATQLYRLLKAGVFNGCEIYRYEPGFVLQTSSAETKVSGNAALTLKQQDMIRRLPLEITSQKDGAVAHKKWMLSMARYDATDSATTSFSIMLGDAPHLDKQYTLFGKVVADDVSLATVNRIINDWPKGKPYITSCSEESQPVAQNRQQ